MTASHHGEIELQYKPFEELVGPETMLTKARYIEQASDFYRLARFLESDVND